MIRKEEIALSGKLLKPHGLKGEITADLAVDETLRSGMPIVIELEGIYVPFFIDSVRSRSIETYLIKLEGIDSDSEATALADRDLYLLKRDIESSPADGIFADSLPGYTVVDSSSGKSVGNIVDVDFSTENVVMYVMKPDGGEILIPLVDDIIESLDTDNEQIVMDLPAGLLDLN